MGVLVTDLFLFYIGLMLLCFVLIKNKYLFVGGQLLVAFLCIADFLSIKLSLKHIDYLTLARIDSTMIKMAFDVIPNYVFGCIIFIAISSLICFIFNKKVKCHSSLIAKIGCLLISFFCLINSQTTIAYKSILNSISKYSDLSSLSKQELLQKVAQSNIYITEENIKAKAGKNLVIIYCESFDSKFLDCTIFPHETPNLNSMAKNGWYLYNNYRMLPGSNYTVAALYSTQTGFPTFFGTEGTKIFTGIYKNSVMSYGKVLKKAGYTNYFLNNGDLRFAGTGNLMTQLGYECFSAEMGVFDQNSQGTIWGVQDYDLFRFAKVKYMELVNAEKPFNLTLLTIDTHFPKGMPDKRLVGKVSQQIDPDSHEFSIASLDYLLKDFIDFIYGQPNSEDTVIVLLGDHLLLGDTNLTPLVKKLEKGDRTVFLMTNKEITGFTQYDEIAFYDIPNIILSLSEVKHNAIMGKKLMPGISEKFIVENELLFTKLNIELNK